MVVCQRSANKLRMLLLLLYVSVALIAGEEHEIVYPKMIIGRSGDKRVLFRAFDEDFHLRLEPTDVLSDDFVLITRDEKGDETFLKPDIEHWRNRILQDPVVGSTIAVDEEEGSLQIKGVINEKLRIEPALDRIDSNDDGNIANRGKNLEGRQGSVKEVPHRVVKINPRTSDGSFFDEIVPPGVKPIDINMTEERQTGPIVLETAIVTDQIHSKRTGSDENCIKYCCVLINSVNLAYQTMASIRVIFRLVGIKRNLSPSDQPYIENNMYDNCVLSDRVVSDFGKYCAEKNIFASADLVHLVTAQPMGNKVEGSTKADLSTIGIAYVGGVCDKNYRVGCSEDDGYRFDGCATVAHEFCHNCGCPHDGDSAPSYIKDSPGAAACPWDDGYRMSYIARDDRQYCFSKCSEKCVEYMAKICSCMTTQNVVTPVNVNDYRLPGQYVGEQLGLNDHNSYYGQRCKERPGNLSMMRGPGETCNYCCKTQTDKNNAYYYWIVKCLDGEPCSTATSNKVCKNGKCVPK